MKFSYCEQILNARVYDVADETPLEQAPRLSERLSNNILLKREDLQPVFSFKLRGAYNKIYHLNEKERANGVIAASAGNHAQGVALVASDTFLRLNGHKLMLETDSAYDAIIQAVSEPDHRFDRLVAWFRESVQRV